MYLRIRMHSRKRVEGAAGCEASAPLHEISQPKETGREEGGKGRAVENIANVLEYKTNVLACGSTR